MRSPGRPLAHLSRSAFVAGALALLPCTVASAQPYAAAGGFGRPGEVVSGAAVPAAAVAVDPAGGVHVAFADGRGVWLRSLAAGAGSTDGDLPANQIASTDAVRQVTAGTVDGSVAVAWIERDRTTGESRHYLAWRGRVAELFRDRLAVPMRIVEVDGRPWVLIARRSSGFSEIVLLDATPEATARAERLLHRTELSVRGADVVMTQEGRALVAWLEGMTERTEFGLVAEWDAYFAAVAPGAPTPPSAIVALGAADVVDERQRATLAASEDGARVAWPGEDGVVRVTDLRLEGTEATRAARDLVLESGRPLAVTSSDVYWVTTDAIRRAALLFGADALSDAGKVDSADDGMAARAGGSETAAANAGAGSDADAFVSVAWSAVTIEGAAFASSEEASSEVTSSEEAASTLDAVHALAWYGRLRGGGVAIYVSDDRVALQPTWRDRLAATMGWRPWALWEEAAGQALTAVVVGIFATVASAPLLWLLALVALPLARRSMTTADRIAAERGTDARRLRRAARRIADATARLGAGLGVVPMALAAAVLARRGAVFGERPLVALAFLAAVASASMAIGFVVARRGDREPQFTVILSAVLTTWVSATVVAFATYRDWAPVLGLA